MSRERRADEQALARLVTELRELPTPNLNWDRIATRLLIETRRPATSPVRSSFARWRLPAAALVALASIAFVLSLHRKPAPPSPSAQVSTTRVDGDRLALGTRVTAGNHGLVIEHAGRARWTLDPHAAASLTSAGEFLTVRLDSGALSANVVPSTKPETFAVEVAGTRVAVHGTAFRVERTADGVQVEVSEGTVAIEPVGAHSEPSFLLRRGSHGSFGLDGQSGRVEGDASTLVHESSLKSEHGSTPPSPAKSQAKARAVTAPSAQASAVGSTTRQNPSALAAQPSISEIESGVSAAVELMNHCFRDKSQSVDIRVSATTAMTLSVSSDGTIESVTFEPPLAPAVEDCGVVGLRALRYARSVDGATFTRVIELKR